jgi:hypothetical protein
MKYLYKVLIIITLSVILGITISGCETIKQPRMEDFSVSLNSPEIPIGEIELQLDSIMGFGKIKKQNVAVSYFPREDAVCLKYKYEFFNYRQFWNRRGRLGFISALQSYNIDYDARNLQSNKYKTLKKYGIVRSYLIWQQLSITVQARANANIELGYTFKEKAPYFTVYQREALYVDENSKDNSRTSPNITMCFTRAQAAELAELFEQYLTTDMQGINEEIDIYSDNTEVPKDIY